MATLDDIDLYGDGLATELNVSQTSSQVKTEVMPAPYIKTEPVQSKTGTVSTPSPMTFPPPPAGAMPSIPPIKQEPVLAAAAAVTGPPPAPIAGVPGVTYVTQDTFAQQNRHQYIDPNDPKSKTVYVGNLTWWTTDQDLIHACASLNVRDITNVKFYENRTNGRSKGYCAVDVGSLNSAKTLMHELRNVTIHNEHPYVAIASKTPLYYFETALGIKNDDKNKKVGFDPAVPPSMPTLPPNMPPLPLPGMPGIPPPGMPPPGMPRMPPPPGCPLPPPVPLPTPPMGITPMLPPPPDLARPPMTMPRPMLPAAPFTPLPVSQMAAPPPVSISAAHVNPAFLPAVAKPEDSMSDQERLDMIDKNHQVCKTAILRAYESCDARDYDQAEGTVAAALKIIKMSAVSDDPKSKAFISDLEECLAYVQKRQKKSKHSSRSGSHRRSERSSEKKSDRSDRRRTRSRSQEETRDRKRDKRSDRSENSRSYSDSHRSKEYEDYKELRRRELI